jgi:predicted RND superfamily exporter protein
MSACAAATVPEPELSACKLPPKRIARYVDFLARHDLAICIAALVLFGLGVAASSRLLLRSDFTELLPQDDPEVTQLKELGEKIGAPSTLVLAVEGPDAAANERFAEALVKNLQPLVGSSLRAIDYRADASKPFFEHNKALYANLVDLQRIDDDVKKLIASKKNPMFLPFADPEKGEEDDDPAKDLHALKERLEAQKPKDAFSSGYYENQDRSLLAIITWTASSGTGDSSGFRIRDDVQRIIDSTRPAAFGQVKASITGDVATAIEEHDALKSDVEWVSMVCTVLVLLVIMLYFRSAFALGYVFFPTLLGVAVAFGITALTIGYLNTNTAFLGSIIIGNGINFGIILLARYREERTSAPTDLPRNAMAKAMAATLRPTLAAALAAGIAYASLTLTGFRGFRQFGFVGGTGMVLCWLATYSYCPALILFWDRIRKTRPPQALPASRTLVAIADVLLRRRRILLGIVAVTTALAAISVAPLVRNPFEYDFSKLRNQQSRKHGAGELYGRVGKMFSQDISPVGVALLASPEDAAQYGQAVLERDCKDGLTRAHSSFAADATTLARECARRVATGEPTGGLLSSISTAFDYLPKDQDAKLALLADLRRRLSGQAMQSLSDENRQLVAEWMPPDDVHRLLPADLPEAIARRFRETDGTVGRVALLFPVRVWANWDGHNLIRLADVTKNVTLPSGHVASAAGHTSLFAAMLRSIAHDGPIATLAAMIGVVVMVVLLFRNVRSSAMVLLSLGVGVVWMGGAGALLHMKLNFLNFVALPITFGIGVDYAVNVFARIADEPPERHARALAETGSAVTLCSSTTIIGYSSLLIASNGALVSFGKLANFGEIGCLLAALLLVPAVSARYQAKRHRRTVAA